MTQHKRRRKGSTQKALDARGGDIALDARGGDIALDARGGDIARDGVVLDLGSNRYKASPQSVPDA